MHDIDSNESYLPVINADNALFGFNFTVREYQKLYWINHCHLFTRNGPSSYLKIIKK